MKAALLIGALACVMGAAAGLGASAWFMHVYGGGKDRVGERTAKPRDESAQQSLAMLAKVVAASDRSNLVAGPASSWTTVQAEDRKRPLSREERTKRWEEKYTARLQRVKTEHRDPTWAEPTERLFRQDFQARTPKFEAELVGLECKTTGCLAEVRWDSYRKAKQKFVDIVHESFSTNCATTMDIGSEPTNPEAPHQALVIFECEKARVESAMGHP